MPGRQIFTGAARTFRTGLTTTSLLVLLALAVSANPTSTMAGSISFLPGADPTDVHPVRANLSVLTYRVPGGLLVADRLASEGEPRFGQAFERQFNDSDFFLVQARGRTPAAAELSGRLAALGRVHWHRDDAFLVEIPADNQIEFASLAVQRARIPLDPPPAGWDRNRDLPVQAPRLGPNKDQALIQDFVANLSGPAFFQTIQEISGNAYFFFNGLKSVSTRYYSTADKDLIADYLADKLTGYGYTVTFEEFLSGSTPCRNIVATRTGTTLPDEYVILGAHYDSISPDPTNTAPGAEDNGSGTAAVMEIARIAAGRDFERTIQIVLFDSEEQGLYGSTYFVQQATGSGRNIIAAITMDMVAYYDTNYAVRIEGETPWEWLMATMENQTELLTDIANQKDYNSWGSDHVPFQQAGIPAFLAIDYDYGGYPGYHRTDDVWNQISASAQIGTQIMTACAATLAEVAVLQSDLSGVGPVPDFGPLALVAYPNPFNPQVSFVFSPPRGLTGEFAVFDVTGRRVAVLARGDFGEGLNRLQWDGTDLNGHAVSSGTYIGRLLSDGQVASVAVNLVR